MKNLAICFLGILSPCLGQSVDYTPAPQELKFTFGGHPPVLHVKPGTTITTWTEDCYYGAVKNQGDMPSKVAPVGKDNPQTGPFYIEGAEPGDILAIHIVDLAPARSYAISSNYPGFGALTGTDYTALLNTPLQERVWWYA